MIGVFVNGCVAGLYALTPAVYDTGVRATGVGTASASAGSARFCRRPSRDALLDVGWTPESPYITVGVVFVATALLLWWSASPPPPHAAQTPHTPAEGEQGR